MTFSFRPRSSRALQGLGQTPPIKRYLEDMQDLTKLLLRRRWARALSLYPFVRTEGVTAQDKKEVPRLVKDLMIRHMKTSNIFMALHEEVKKFKSFVPLPPEVGIEFIRRAVSMHDYIAALDAILILSKHDYHNPDFRAAVQFFIDRALLP